MSVALEIVYRYRQLLAKCEGSAGLTLDEIEQLETLEDSLPAATAVEARAHMRSRKYVDPVTVTHISRYGAICVGCPFLEAGQTLELRIQCGDHSYRFYARVRWAQELEDDTYDAQLAFEGAPVLVRHTGELPAINVADVIAA